MRWWWMMLGVAALSTSGACGCEEDGSGNAAGAGASNSGGSAATGAGATGAGAAGAGATAGSGGLGGGGHDASAGSSGAGASGSGGTTGSDAGAPDGGCSPGECCYRLVESRPGLFHTVTAANPRLSTQPLEAGQGFFCLRVEFTMHTADNLAQTDANYEGCPIFSHIATIQGESAQARVQGTAYFRMLRLDCSPRRPAGLELNAWNDTQTGNLVDTGPWVPGATYRIVQEVKPDASSIELYQNGVQVGPRIEVSIAGATVDQNRDVSIAFGLDKVYENAFFPYYDAAYGDLEIWADVAP
jgi:hypothetical protein